MQQLIYDWRLVERHEDRTMSKQLALSSAFATFAMAAMVLTFTPNHGATGAGEMVVPVQAEMPSLDLPKPSFFK